MNINNMSDVMAVVTEMMNFPLKTNVVQPSIVSPTEPTSHTFAPQTPSTFAPTTRLHQFDGQTTINPYRLPSSPTTANRFEHKITDTPPRVTLTATQPPNLAFPQQTITKEGNFGNIANTNTDRYNTDTKTTISNQPIFVSNLGELSTDAGTKFDINKSKIVKPDTNNPITPAPISPKQQADNQLKQSLAASFQQRQHANAGDTQRISDQNLLQSLQQVLRQNPDAVSGEADLIEFIQRILARNPDLTPDQLNAILSTESDSIVDILANSVDRNRNSPAEDGKAQLLNSIQNVLNRYKAVGSILPANSAAPVIGNTIPFAQQTPIIGAKIPIFQTTPAVGSVIPIVHTTPVIGRPVSIVKNPPSIISSFPIVQTTPAIGRPISNPVLKSTPVTGGTISIAQNLPSAGRHPVPVLAGVIEPQIIELDANDNRPLQIPFGPIVPLSTTPGPIQFVSQHAFNQPNSSPTNKPILNTGLNAFGLPQAPVSPTSVQHTPSFGAGPSSPSPLQPPNAANISPANQGLGGAPIESGEADLIQIVQQILRRTPNQLTPIFSGEADLVRFIEQIKQQNADFSVSQLNAIISGEANSILLILSSSAQRNQANGYPQIFEADLLEAIQLVIQKYRLNNNELPPLPDPIYTGENDLMTTLNRIQQQISIPILSGSADLLEFIRRIEHQNPHLTPDQLNAIISGEAESILQMYNERRAQNGGIQSVYSGSADLLEAIQQVLAFDVYSVNVDFYGSYLLYLQVIQKSRERASNAASSGLLQTLKQIKQQSPVPLFSSDSDLLQFSDRLQQQNPKLTPTQLNDIITREISSILTYLTDKRDKDPFNNFAVYSGEDDLLVAVQYYVEQYALPENGAAVKPPSPSSPSPTPTPTPLNNANLQQTLRKIQEQITIPVYSGEADLVQFIEQIQQRNPDFTPDQLTAIISGEKDSILQILNGKLQNAQNAGVPVLSGKMG